MKTGIDDLNEHLFLALERLNDDEVCSDRESIMAEVARAEEIKNIAMAIVGAGHLQLEFEKLKSSLKTDGFGRSLFSDKKEPKKICANP